MESPGEVSLPLDSIDSMIASPPRFWRPFGAAAVGKEMFERA
jgi:hypothetical protein